VPLSEEEQRILHEMEQKLYENDRAFVDRVRTEGPRAAAGRAMRWSIATFIAGFAILLLAFRTSLVVGTFGFLVMLFASLIFERSVRQVVGHSDASAAPSRAAAGDLGAIGRRLRSKIRKDR